MSDTKTFHESWYRIANQNICLRPSVRVRRQMFRGSRWYVLFDPMSNQYFRLRPSAYAFVSRLSLSKTVEEVWKESISRDPENAPGQEDVIHLLAQLYHANLLHYKLSADSTRLFDRYKKRKQKIMQSILLNIFFFRIPLFDPDQLLKRLMPLIRLLIGPIGTAIWFLVVGLGIKVVLDHFSELSIQSQGILAPSNLFLLYVGLVIVKTLHEFDHAFAVRRFGGEVHIMGVMFLIFSPLPYMDATAAWAFKNKWHRILVGAAGMIVEIFVAVCALFIWANTGPGVIHSLTYNIIFIASISTIIFNINPLLRFDGYYILSDLLDIPNLHQQASKQLIYLIEKYAFDSKQAENPTNSRKEAFWLSFFGIASHIYRILVFSAILFIIADKFLIIGMVMAACCAISWILVPIIRLIKYFATNPHLERTRVRAILVCSTGFFVALTFLYFCPFPKNFKAPGIVKASEYRVCVNEVEGYVQEILVPSRTYVKAGQSLLILQNKELFLKIKELKAKLNEMLIMKQNALSNKPADIKTAQSLVLSVTEQLQKLYKDKENLIIKAEIDGIWVAPNINDYVGMWLKRGTVLGQLINDQMFYFTCVISQEDAARLFSNEIKSVKVKLKGQTEITIPVHSYIKIPMEQTQLPSMALGWGGGGDIPINPKDPSGVKTAEPFYEVRAFLDSNTDAMLLHGRSGKVKFALKWEPLLQQWIHKLRQLLQKRYQV